MTTTPEHLRSSFLDVEHRASLDDLRTLPCRPAPRTRASHSPNAATGISPQQPAAIGRPAPRWRGGFTVTPGAHGTAEGWQRSSRTGTHADLACEPPAPYDAGGSDPLGNQNRPRKDAPEDRGSVSAGAAGDGSSTHADVLAAAIDGLCTIDMDELSNQQLADQLAELRIPLGRLRSLQARWAAALEARRIAAAPPQRAGAAQREARNELANQQQITPSETKRLVEAGRAARRNPATGRAFADGKLTPDHVRVMDSLLTHLEPDLRARLEPQLIELGARTNATSFGRKARELVAAAEPAALAAAEFRARGRRYLRRTDTPDGGFAFSGLLYGTAAETARIALDAFTRPDAGGEHRTPEQRAADGFEQLCAVALATEDAPTQHGTRPQVMVTIAADQLEAARDGNNVGHGTFVWSGQPVTTRELGHVLDDCSLFGILLDADRAPIEVTTHVRTVPTGLYRALLARDGGCSWEGCEAPAAWCDVAHGQEAFRNQGRLKPSNAALLCRSHHRRFDHGPWRIDIDGDKVRYLRTADPP